MSRAVITGGAGFLGSHLADRLLAAGMEVVAIDNLITGSTANIAHLDGNDAFEFLRHDVTQPIQLSGPVDIVFHFASPASPVDYLELPIETLLVGSAGTHQTLEMARAKNARYVMASTSEIYGDPTVHPQTEEYWGNVNPNGTRSVYDEAKRFAESMTFAYRRLYNMDCKIVRIFNTYGPRMRIRDGRVVPTFISQALRAVPLTIYGDGSQTRSFCYVSDLIEGIFRLAMSEQSGPINIGNPTELTMLQFADEILRATSGTSALEYHPLPTEDDPKQRNPDISKARSLLGWEPKVPLAEGLAATIEYFRDQLKQESSVGVGHSGTS